MLPIAPAPPGMRMVMLPGTSAGLPDQLYFTPGTGDSGGEVLALEGAGRIVATGDGHIVIETDDARQRPRRASSAVDEAPLTAPPPPPAAAAAPAAASSFATRTVRSVLGDWKWHHLAVVWRPAGDLSSSSSSSSSPSSAVEVQSSGGQAVVMAGIPPAALPRIFVDGALVDAQVEEREEEGSIRRNSGEVSLDSSSRDDSSSPSAPSAALRVGYGGLSASVDDLAVYRGKALEAGQIAALARGAQPAHIHGKSIGIFDPLEDEAEGDVEGGEGKRRLPMCHGGHVFN